MFFSLSNATSTSPTYLQEIFNALNAMPVYVQSLLLAGQFLYNQKQPTACEGEVERENSLKKNTDFSLLTLYVRASDMPCTSNSDII